ncbi:hypothetical protein LRR81_19895 [Metabacillus sp. GX 13764]|uniref:hypothetical protein n=1 Tax=Metabacillus kandeliae TaxID=2900151 RepID=UPI001E45DA8E|nr:hypothetical protein [Metabacillus kandeliae]MCD7036515.1 hypothetical protein [Metabacillus kandeliae]
MKNEQIKQMTDALLLKSGSAADMIIDTFFPDGRLIGGKYNLGSHTITIYTETIKRQCMQMFHSLERYAEYLEAVCAHEIGHAEDLELEGLAERLENPSASDSEKKRIALKIEENAWEYAEKLLPEADPEFFQTIVNQSLESYRDALLMPGA